MRDPGWKRCSHLVLFLERSAGLHVPSLHAVHQVPLLAIMTAAILPDGLVLTSACSG